MQYFLFVFGYFFEMVAYLLLVLFWAEVYHGQGTLSANKQTSVKITKYIFMVIGFILFIMQLSAVIIYSAYTATSDIFRTLFDGAIAFVCLGISGGMCVYALLIFRKLKRNSLQFGTDLRSIAKLTRSTIIVSATLFTAGVAVITILSTNALNSAIGVILSFSIGFVLEMLLCLEMFYLMQPPKLQEQPSLTDIALLTARNAPSTPQSFSSVNEITH